jgi:glycine betaine/proline transport system substrate-binding protein
MKRMKHVAALLSIAVLYLASPTARATEIVMGHPSTPYGDALLSVIKAALDDRFGVKARIMPASSPVNFKAMDAGRGDVDIATVQLPNSQSLIDEYVTRKGTVIRARNEWQFHQGICTIKSVADKYGIKTVYDMTRPEVVQLTAKGGEKGEFWIGAAEWNSTAIDRARSRYYGLTDLYNLTTSQADLEYARVASAIKTETPIFWSCDGASNFIFPKGSVVIISEPPHDPAKWRPVMPSQDPDWYQKTRVETAWPLIRMAFAYSKRLQTELPEVAHLIEGIKLDPDQIGAWTYATITEKRDRDEYAKEWVKNNSAVIDSWLAR